jgi:hypothetical protein
MNKELQGNIIIENQTYTLNIRQLDKYRYEITIPEIGVTTYPNAD